MDIALWQEDSSVKHHLCYTGMCRAGPEVFCFVFLSKKFTLLMINVKNKTIVGILTFVSMIA